ncbi:MAG: phage baseplate assembly protein V [Lachnospiraceae bacterium]|nr:phage baseplate assembly protein V [Lachnospiraceae bacterium]
MREEKITIRPFEELQVEHYEGLKQVNVHGYVKVTGTIPFDRKEEYLGLGREQTWVRITAVSGDIHHILFYGILESMKLHVSGQTCTMELVVYSGTLLMDHRERIRSFQASSLTYRDLLDVCGQGYEDARARMTVGEGRKIGQLIMQYQETDWAFVKRLASMNQTVIMPSCTEPGEKYYFGLPDGLGAGSAAPTEYRTQCDIEEYWQKKSRGMDISPQDTISYIWEDREIYELGGTGIIDGQKMTIWKVETHMRGSELYHTYYMRRKAGIGVPVEHNARLSGASLFGRVLNVDREKVTIRLTEDENKGKSGARWFPYASVYSSPDGTGWYCMPEIGDQIRLYFPSEKETEAYAASAYHEGDGGLRTNPACKFWRNKEGKEIQLSPDKILLTNNHGTYIELSDAEGIKMVSEGTVSIRANGTMFITSQNSSIELSATDKIRLKQGETEIKLGGDLYLTGAQVKL